MIKNAFANNLTCLVRGVSVFLLIFLLLDYPLNVYADHPGDEDEHTDSEAQVVEFPSSFFQRYQPNTALDMVNQIPGFQLDDGQDTRGFATAAGNILINDKRPNVKQDSPSSILSRIPAGSVDKIDLIRGQVSGVDLQGQPVVANIILHQDTEAAIRWEAYVWKNSENDYFMPGGAFSLSNRWNDLEYNIGIDGNWHTHSTVGTRNSYDRDGILSEDRTENIFNTHLLLNPNLTASTTFGDTLFQLNIKGGYSDVVDDLTADRIPQAAGSMPRQEQVVDDRLNKDFEIGLTAERLLTDNLLGKGILIYNLSDFDELSTQEIINNVGDQTLLRIQDRGTNSQEIIARSEFDWSLFDDHTIQFNIEGAYNELEGILVQTVDTGAGPVLEDVPGSNTKVKETRGDFLLADTWSFGSMELNYGIGAEVSKLTQTGDNELERNFFFIKPHGLLLYSPEQGRQTRLRIAREVSQLDFNDFVSASILSDNDVSLGNPNLKPDTTWVADLTHERRFGDISVVKVRLYHHWISDVEDLLPLSPTFEAPGNIGNGRRWGAELESTIPMDWLRLRTSRLDFKVRWQDSSVTDPVTEEKRVLSSEGRIAAQIRDNIQDLKYYVAVNFRQDLEEERMAWGWELVERSERPLFKVNELDVFNEGVELNLFIETTRWFGVKMQLKARDLINGQKTRTRTIYEGERELSLVERTEITDVVRGRQIELLFSGSF